MFLIPSPFIWYVTWCIWNKFLFNISSLSSKLALEIRFRLFTLHIRYWVTFVFVPPTSYREYRLWQTDSREWSNNGSIGTFSGIILNLKLNPFWLRYFVTIQKLNFWDDAILFCTSYKGAFGLGTVVLYSESSNLYYCKPFLLDTYHLFFLLHYTTSASPISKAAIDNIESH